jgi:hypothetical protein
MPSSLELFHSFKSNIQKKRYLTEEQVKDVSNTIDDILKNGQRNRMKQIENNKNEQNKNPTYIEKNLDIEYSDKVVINIQNAEINRTNPTKQISRQDETDFREEEIETGTGQETNQIEKGGGQERKDRNEEVEEINYEDKYEIIE